MKIPQLNSLNPMQMINNFFGNNLPKFDEGFFRSCLPHLKQEQINQIAAMAKSFGLTDEQINSGMEFLNRFKN